jgi:hypothetical protein
MQPKFDQLAISLRKQFPKFRLKIKEQSELMLFLNFFIKRFNKEWLEYFTMTVGYTVYMPESFIGTPAGYEILRHEAVHVKDYHKWKILYCLSYLFLMPVVVTARAFWEFRGYVESMRVEHEASGQISDATINWLTNLFASGAYFWMCPFKKFIRRKLEKARREILTGGK